MHCPTWIHNESEEAYEIRGQFDYMGFEYITIGDDPYEAYEKKLDMEALHLYLITPFTRMQRIKKFFSRFKKKLKWRLRKHISQRI